MSKWTLEFRGSPIYFLQYVRRKIDGQRWLAGTNKDHWRSNLWLKFKELKYFKKAMQSIPK